MAGFPPSQEPDSRTMQNFHGPLLERRRRLEAALTTAPAEQHLEHLLGEVDQALTRLADGCFGVCETCQGEIEEERLSSDPLRRVCLDCLSVDEQRALEYDLELASRIQDCLLPDRDLEHSGWQIHLSYHPLGTVGGDYGDLIPSPTGDGSLFFVLGDVSGKGVSAALLMSHLQAVYRSLVTAGNELERVMEQANRLFCNATPANSFATIVAGVVAADGEVRIANAGHCPALFVRGGSVTAADSSGMPLGMFCSSSFSVEQLQMTAGDCLFLFTDGLSERLDRNDREYGVDRIREVLGNVDRSSAREVTAAVLRDHEAWAAGKNPNDDLSVMVIRRT